MPIVDCSKDIRAYHNERVTLGKDEQQEMHDRREAGRTRLTCNLEKQGRPQPAEIASQGSYAMRTMGTYAHVMIVTADSAADAPRARAAPSC